MQDSFEKISKLRQAIERYNKEYYVLDAPTISDTKYDSLFKELLQLEARYPDFYDATSPTQQIGTKSQGNGFKSAKHQTIMLSLDNAFEELHLFSFDKRVRNRLKKTQNIDYVCEPKIDGIAVNLIYREGILLKGITRGDGTTGEEITENLRAILDIPKYLKGNDYPHDFEIRGEVYMKTTAFRRLNTQLQKMHQKVFVNPRNAASGSLRQLDHHITAKRSLSFFAHGYGNVLMQKGTTHSQRLEQLQQWGIPCCEQIKIVSGIDGCIDYYQKIHCLRSTLPYEIDGIVCKVNCLDDQITLGYATRTPRWAIAYKFKAQEAKTQVLDITFQVGRTGILTPVARLNPIFVGGATIRNATLHNYSEMRRKDIRIGDTVIVRRAGDVIPEIVRVLHSLRDLTTKEPILPKICPICSAPLLQVSGEIAIRCTGKLHCKAQLKASLFHFASRMAMDIDGMGEQLITQLVDQKKLSNIAELYILTLDDLIPLERMGKRSAEKLLRRITQSKQTTLPKFLYSLGIPFVGINTSKKLAENFLELKALMNAEKIQLEKIQDIGKITAAHIHTFFQTSINQKMIQDLLMHGINWPAITKSSQNWLAGQRFVITGKLQESREKIMARLQQKGAEISTHISSKTHYLVVGESPGSKLEKAERFNIKKLSEIQLLELLALNR